MATETITPTTWEAKDEYDNVRASMVQFPLKLAWAMMIHKSQGMTLDALVCDVSQCFAPGQTYVALSRVRSIEGLSLTEPMESKHVIADPKIVEFCESVEV